jgi:hypothetical protein
MPYAVIDGNSSTEDWQTIFAKRARPTEQDWSWCALSYARKAEEGGICPRCRQKVGITWRGKRELRPHLASPIDAGVYLIEVGVTDRSGGKHCFKIGCSKDVPGRLVAHLRDQRHERCTVLHCLPCPPGWQICNAIECILSDQLVQRGAHSFSGKTWDYYEWRDDLVDFSTRFLVPGLVEGVLEVVQDFASSATKPE